MSGLQITIDQAKGLFFDRKAVLTDAERKERRIGARWGAYARRVARNSLKSSAGTSEPGRPPFSHTRLLKDLILFARDPSTGSTVVGPAKTNQVFFRGNGRPATGTVPGVLERGGKVGILEVLKYGRWRRADLRSKRRLDNLPTRLRWATYRPRPYMGPAVDKTNAKLPSIIAEIGRRR